MSSHKRSLTWRCTEYYEPPSPEWVPFGSNADTGISVVFSAEMCECGLPLWERPAKKGEKAGKSIKTVYYDNTYYTKRRPL